MTLIRSYQILYSLLLYITLLLGQNYDAKMQFGAINRELQPFIDQNRKTSRDRIVSKKKKKKEKEIVLQEQ